MKEHMDYSYDYICLFLLTARYTSSDLTVGEYSFHRVFTVISPCSL
jgi:hypothetical protein